MNIKKRLLFVSLIGFISIQFFQPIRNVEYKLSDADIVKVYVIPDTVLTLFKIACYDCHSNNTVYPWYSYIQPIGWQLNKDIRNGKKMLNFSEFDSYSSRRKISKWRDIENRINDGTMPLRIYKVMHKQARLSQKDRKIILTWIQNTIK